MVVIILEDSFWIKIYENEYIKEKLSLRDLHNKYGYSVTSIHRNFQRLGLKCRSIKENGRIYRYNYNYFDEINTEDKAYFLGLFYADGYVTLNRIGIALKSNDIDILYKFLECIESDAKPSIYTNKGYNGKCKPTEYCRIVISNKHLSETIIKQGVLRNKSSKLFPPKIPSELVRHFIRGFMDGDGSIYGCKEHKVSFTGTKDMLNFIGNFFIENNIINRFSLYSAHGSEITYSLCIGGNIQCEKALDLLYKNATVYLERKHNKYLQIKQNSHLTQ